MNISIPPHIKNLVVEIDKAKEKYEQKKDYMPLLDPSECLFTQLKENLKKADQWCNNFKIFQMTITGIYLEEDPSKKDQFEENLVKAFLLLAKLFPHPVAVMYLENTKPNSFQIKDKYLDYVINSQRRKLDLVCGTVDLTGREGKKRRVYEKDETGEYLEAWFNKEIVTGKDGLWEYNNQSSGSRHVGKETQEEEVIVISKKGKRKRQNKEDISSQV
jgi:hypothetical protein